MIVTPYPPSQKPHVSPAPELGFSSSGWSFRAFTHALSFQAALRDSPLFAINCDILLEALITNDEKNSHCGLNRVWRGRPFQLCCTAKKTKDGPLGVSWLACLSPPAQFCLLLLFSQCQGLDLCTHMCSPAPGRLVGARQLGKERNAISSLGVCLPLNSVCFH